ncbi:MAG: hypothetical protein HYY01_15620 [Chloroflexi bacterium]|nr:hypothetical protein [Chloroflexota bacterium]
MPSEPAGPLTILHVVRRVGDGEALAVARAQRAAGHQVTLLLLQDAVLDRPDFSGPVLTGAEDVQARGGRSTYPGLSYEAIVRLVFESQRVVSW